jgi:hypothetical protein
MSHFLTPTLTTLELEFDHDPPSTFMLRIFEVISHAAPNLQTLVILKQFQWQPHASHQSLAFDEVICSVMRKLTSLETLHFEPSWVNIRVLDAIGSLQHLKKLILYNKETSASVSLPRGRIGQRPGNLSCLLHLEISTELSALDNLLNTYFSVSPASITTLAVHSYDASILAEKFMFLNLISPSLKKVEFYFQHFNWGPSNMIDPFTFDCLNPLKHSPDLHTVQIYMLEHLSLDRNQFCRFLGFCQNLRDVNIITGQIEFENGFLSPNVEPDQVECRAGFGLDLSCLGLIARNLPRLENLRVSISASSTSELEPDQGIIRFQSLICLEVHRGFLNWRFDGFSPFEACRYLSLLLPSYTVFHMKKLNSADFLNHWRSFVERHTKFINDFEQRLEEYRKLRRGHDLYLAANKTGA